MTVLLQRAGLNLRRDSFPAEQTIFALNENTPTSNDRDVSRVFPTVVDSGFPLVVFAESEIGGRCCHLVPASPFRKPLPSELPPQSNQPKGLTIAQGAVAKAAASLIPSCPTFAAARRGRHSDFASRRAPDDETRQREIARFIVESCHVTAGLRKSSYNQWLDDRLTA